MSTANIARVKLREELEKNPLEDLPELPPGPWCPETGHGFTCPCTTCSEYWGTSAGTMVWQAWQDHARAVGDL